MCWNCDAILLSAADRGAPGCWVHMRGQQGLHELHRRASAHSPCGSSRRSRSIQEPPQQVHLRGV